MNSDPRAPFVRPYDRATDIETVVDIICSSMVSTTFYELSLPLREEKPLEYWKVTSRKLRTISSSPKRKLLVAEDPISHKVVGIAAWEVEGILTERPEWRVDSFSNWLERRLTKYENLYHKYAVDRVSNSSAYQLFKDQEEDKFRVPKSCQLGYLGLVWLCIDPAHQRRGIGMMLLHWGLELGAKEGIPVCLSSTEFGHGLYQRTGFKVFDHIELNVGEIYMRMPCMLWEPPQRAGQLLESDGNGIWRLRPNFFATSRTFSNSTALNERRGLH